MRFLSLICLIGFLFSTPVLAADSHGMIMIMNPQIPASAGAAKSGAGYFTIMNHGSSDDRLLAVEADFPRIEIHTIEEVDGVTKMVEQADGVAIPAGETAMFAPGGLHVMFMGLSDPFEISGNVKAVLVFEHAGRKEIVFSVVDRGALKSGAGSHEHSN